MKSINLGIAFLLELCLLAVFSYIGFHLGLGAIGGWIAGIVSPLLVAILWGRMLAPRAAHRLEMPGLLVLKVVLFMLAVAGLLATDKVVLGIWFGAISLVHFVFAFWWKQV